jgi:hypothetical protein
LEQIAREHVGLTTARFGQDGARSETLSATLPNDCMDDSDFAAEIDPHRDLLPTTCTPW